MADLEDDLVFARISEDQSQVSVLWLIGWQMRDPPTEFSRLDCPARLLQ